MPGESDDGDGDVSNNPGPELGVEMRVRGRAAYRVPLGGPVVPGGLPPARALETGGKVGAELGVALHHAVARIGAEGPQAAALLRIRRAARIRRRRRTIMAGGLGVLLTAATVGAALSDGFGAISAVLINR